MQEKDNVWHKSQPGDEREREPVQVPPALLPDVLHRLGLTSEQKSSAPSMADELKKLKSADWEARVGALHALGKLTGRTHVDVFVSALDDEDGTVRAAALYALGNMGRRAPLHCLVAALHDPDWHVRETAVFALGKQGSRVPREVLLTALHDSDVSVRDAVGLALQWNSADEEAFAPYGQLWEEKSMHDQSYDTNRSKSNGRSVSSETPPSESWNGMEYRGNAYGAHGVQEQVQAYAAREQAPYDHTLRESAPYDEHSGVMSSYGEKITSHRLHRKPHKGWWVLVAVIALVFLMVGRFTTLVVPQFTFPGVISKTTMVQPQSVKNSDQAVFFNPTYASMVRSELSAGLRLSSDQLTTRLTQDGSLAAVATAQSVSKVQLQALELAAAQHAVDAALKAGDISPSEAAQWKLQLESQGFLEKSVLAALDVAAGKTP